jgi:lipopolysaccharide heptosyltransferase II
MSWKDCKNILIIRPDNMGDLIMSAPAIRALKETFGAKITVLTSTMAKGIVNHIPEIDEAIIFDLPWVKTANKPDVSVFNQVVAQLTEQHFDAAVIFTVYSQNPLPTAMLAYLAGIPRILAYCRENPYHLITDWAPDKEPYDLIKHQVRRDLDLVATVGATTKNENLHLNVDENLWPVVSRKLADQGFDVNQQWLILHAGVSEKKREYPVERWVATARQLIKENGYRILLTGSASEKNLTDELAMKIGEGSLSAAGLFGLDEFICLVKHAPVMLSVNTGTIHIAAAVGTPIVVLYAETNPQHTPWSVPCKVLYFSVPDNLKSKNEVIVHVNNTHYASPALLPTADEVVNAVNELINSSTSLSTDQPFDRTPNQNQAFAAN